MSDLLSWLKELYEKAENNKFDWKPVYPNNMKSNGIAGIYFDVNTKKGDKYQYLKFTIQYQARCDEKGISHPWKTPEFYILHSLKIDDLDAPIEIPEPSERFTLLDDDNKYLVNDYGRFRYAFRDEETAKSVALNDIKMMIYPYLYLLSPEESLEWNQFVKTFKNPEA